MKFVWDENKNRANKRKHKLSFDTASLVFDDPYQVTLFEGMKHGEERWKTVGLVAGFAIVLVAHTIPNDHTIRIYSARKAEPEERRGYDKANYR